MTTLLRPRRWTPVLLVLLAALGGALGAPALASDSEPTPGAVSVLDPAYGLTGDAGADPDATAAFAAAMADAETSDVRYDAGPSGPQAVVLVPAGSYRLSGLVVPSNLRLEVDADAVLEPVTEAVASAAPPQVHMIVLGNQSGETVTNVSIVGVGAGSPDSGLKSRAQPTYDDWDISGYFTVDLDPADTGAPNDYGFAALTDVADFEISNVYVVQNDTIPSCTASSPGCPIRTGPYPAPTTGRGAILYKPAHVPGTTSAGPFHDPAHGRLADVYSVGAPYGTGPTQITAGHDLDFEDLYSEGGTTLRLETDNPRKDFTELAEVRADHVVGVRCNRAVSLAAHRQHNRAVSITDVTAVGCQSALVQSSDGKRGSFTGTTVSGVDVVGGPSAQVGRGTQGLWGRATSTEPVENYVRLTSWSAAISGLGCSASWTATRFDRILLDGSVQRPVCAAG